jgi:hypothetical protein
MPHRAEEMIPPKNTLVRRDGSSKKGALAGEVMVRIARGSGGCRPYLRVSCARIASPLAITRCWCSGSTDSAVVEMNNCPVYSHLLIAGGPTDAQRRTSRMT